MIRLSEGDLYAYIKRVDLRTRMAAGQSAYNQLPGVSFSLSQVSAPTYLLRVRAEYDHHDTAAMARWGLSIVDAYRLGMRQATFQLIRNGLLYGFNPANGEGLVRLGRDDLPAIAVERVFQGLHAGEAEAARTKARKCLCPFSASSPIMEKSSDAQSPRSMMNSSWPFSSM